MVLLAKFYDSFRREVVMIHFKWRDLRNFMILTVLASEVATRTGNGEAFGARMEMVERFLFYGVNGQ